MFCNWRSHLILFALLVTKSNLAVEVTKESILAVIRQVIYEDTYREIRDHDLPMLHRTSRQMQKMIVKITEKYSTMQDYKDVINQTCLTTSIVHNMTVLSRNLTRIMNEEVPLMEEKINQTISELEEIRVKLDHFANEVKQQPVSEFNMEKLKRLQALTSSYSKSNDKIQQINRQLSQILNEIVHPGLASIDKYNACLAITAQSLLDHGIDQLMKNEDDTQLAAEELLNYNRTDL
ncbi:unnamed protein product [Adineta ricciae]|uniref:Uncharacterized protein n=1 Tax=Adineta ricciae TaxID=249248 RepID=A0A816CDM8_ADIRI|nr:unnamed protein product [Adineta ricciae]